MTLLIFLLILSLLVLIHEFGHFWTAKKFGIKVEEFGLGYPPKAVTLYTDKDGTEYTLNWLPFGGFVRMYGEDGEASVKQKIKDAFFSKPAWQRMIVVLAGVFLNFVTAILAFGAIYTYVGIPTNLEAVRLEEISPDSPAEMAGLQPGDMVTQVSFQGEMTAITEVAEFVAVLGEHAGDEITFLVEREEQEPFEADLYVRTQEEIPEGQGAVGVVVNDFELKRFPMWQMPLRGMMVGTRAAFDFGVLLLKALGTMVGDIVRTGKTPAELAGPVGIVHMAQQQGVLTQGWLARINFAAILSINLAIVNLLPFPALDGGRAVFLLYEMIFRRRVKPIVEHYANMFGFTLLVSMIILVSIRDIKRLVTDEAVVTWFRSLIGL